MLLTSAFHGPINPENLYFHDQEEGIRTVPTYDWVLEALKWPPEEVKKHVEGNFWNFDAFKNYRNWVIQTYGTTSDKILASKWAPWRPVWDRQDSSSANPIAWYNSKTGELAKSPGEKSQVFLDEPAREPHLVSASPKALSWARIHCKALR